MPNLGIFLFTIDHDSTLSPSNSVSQCGWISQFLDLFTYCYTRHNPRMEVVTGGYYRYSRLGHYEGTIKVTQSSTYH